MRANDSRQRRGVHKSRRSRTVFCREAARMKSRRSRALQGSLVERELPAQWAEGLDSQYHLLGGSSSSRRLGRENAAAGRRTGEPAFQAGNGRPHHLFFRKRWCRLAVPEKNRRGSRCLLPLLKQKSTPDTPTGRVGIAPVKPPLCKGRCPRSGRRDCLAGFRLPAGFPRGGGAFSLRYVGVQGAFHLPVEHYGFTPPGAFSLGPLQRPVLFSREKRMGGWRAPLLGGGYVCALWAHRTAQAAARQNSSAAPPQSMSARCALFPAAVLIFLPAAAGAGVVAALPHCAQRSGGPF